MVRAHLELQLPSPSMEVAQSPGTHFTLSRDPQPTDENSGILTPTPREFSRIRPPSRISPSLPTTD